VQVRRSNLNVALNAAVLALAMLGLAYASVPLYRLFCQVTGFGGTTQTALVAPGAVNGQHTINIRFNSDIDAGLPWKFAPGQSHMVVKIGEQSLSYFKAKNLAKTAVSGRAVYNVVPHQAGAYFVKIACFCFEKQTLAAGQEVDMPVSFYIDPAILDDPAMKDVGTITLSYTFFPLKTEK
jgi:cytochrome c oxidase assembly protein subunit 11